MAIEVVPEWMINLDEEDISFIKRFILASGSLKEIAKEYGVTPQSVSYIINHDKRGSTGNLSNIQSNRTILI